MHPRNALLLLLLFVSCGRAEKLDLSRLKVSSGFQISVFAQVPHPRMMTFSPGGVLLATDTTNGKILAFPDSKHSGRAEKLVAVVSDLNAPHGIAFHNGKLFVAETNQVQRYDWDESSLRATNAKVIAQLPKGGMHFTRTLLFASGKMYVAAGSDCNACDEEDKRRAAVSEYNEDGSGGHIFALGLRNAVGLAASPKTGTIWTTENGRDWLGDNLPPDEINDLGKSGGDFGWPSCYGDRTPDASQSGAGAKRCESTIPPRVKLQAHSAPLGLAFYTGTMFPPEYRGDLFVALHGSWNRKTPTGYKVIRVKLNDKGEVQETEDFITGWLRPEETRRGVWMGRPVGLVVGPDGALYISDDSAGVIYRVIWK